MARTTPRGKWRAANVYIWLGESIPKVRKRTKVNSKTVEGRNAKDGINETENKEPIEKEPIKSENKR